MASFAESISIAVSPDVAFAYLADPSTATIIDPAVVYYRPDTIPMDVGTQIDAKARAYGMRFRFHSEVVEWDVPHRMVMRSVKPSRPISVIAEHRFEPEGAGTRYTWSATTTPSVPGGRAAGALFCRFMAANARRQQLRFKSVLEG